VVLDGAMDDDDGLGWRFWGGLVGACLAIGVGLLLFFAVFNRAVYQWGFLGAFIAIAAVLLLIGWFYDRRQVRKYEEA
jgi:uncharacterized membrane protein HdeD (DUF308 family)